MTDRKDPDNLIFDKAVLWGTQIKYVLLDMDGTLLDRYFDDYFWEHFMPEKYAEMHNITFGSAKDELLKKYKYHEGTLNWTDIDFWSAELGLDIQMLKEQIRHLIELHPQVEAFLALLKKRNKKVFLVTNAHLKVLDLKMKKTNISKYFERCITSSEMGYPKEDLRFWHKAKESLCFNEEETLFIDDTEEILRTACKFGIKYLLYKARASSRAEYKESKEFPAVHNFNHLLE